MDVAQKEIKGRSKIDFSVWIEFFPNSKYFFTRGLDYHTSFVKKYFWIPFSVTIVFCNGSENLVLLVAIVQYAANVNVYNVYSSVACALKGFELRKITTEARLLRSRIVKCLYMFWFCHRNTTNKLELHPYCKTSKSILPAQ